jgi:uncharacterized membrane protein YtjA (UPF0391 family)
MFKPGRLQSTTIIERYRTITLVIVVATEFSFSGVSGDNDVALASIAKIVLKMRITILQLPIHRQQETLTTLFSGH